MAIILAFLVVLFLAGVLAVCLPYWFETGNSPSKDIPALPYTPRAVAKLWLDASISAFMLCAAFVLDPIARHAEKLDKRQDGDKLPPVLLVHGLYHNASGWLYLRKKLFKSGFHKVHTFSYSSCHADIESISARLNNAIAALEDKYPGEKILLVGHSLGGLLIRNWLALAENQSRILGAATLGAPHRGSKMAALAFGRLGRSLTPENPFFAELAKKEAPATVPCIALVSQGDTMVLPLQSLVPVSKGWELRIAPFATHAGMLCKGAVLRMLVWELHRMLAAQSEAETEATATPKVEVEPAITPEAEVEPAITPEAEDLNAQASTESTAKESPVAAQPKEIPTERKQSAKNATGKTIQRKKSGEKSGAGKRKRSPKEK